MRRLALLLVALAPACGAPRPTPACKTPAVVDQVNLHGCFHWVDGGALVSLGGVAAGACPSDVASAWLLWPDGAPGATFVPALGSESFTATGAHKQPSGCTWDGLGFQASTSAAREPSMRVTFRATADGGQLQAWRCDATGDGGVACIPVL